MPVSPMDTLHMRGSGLYLMDRDPLLFHAMAAHGSEWRPDLTATLKLDRDDARGLPGVQLSTLEHRLEWPDGTSKAVFLQYWNARQGVWIADFHLHQMPETLAMALEGRPLSRVIGVPGADRWIISSVEIDIPEQTRLILGRATRI